MGVYWTGEEICAREFSAGHLTRVAEALRRKPTLWDNYPVNDGPWMSHFLHLRGFTGRPSVIGTYVAAHAINPALQPHLSLIPAATLAASYREGNAYCYMHAFQAVGALAGADLADMLERDLHASGHAALVCSATTATRCASGMRPWTIRWRPRSCAGSTAPTRPTTGSRMHEPVSIRMPCRHRTRSSSLTRGAERDSPSTCTDAGAGRRLMPAHGCAGRGRPGWIWVARPLGKRYRRHRGRLKPLMVMPPSLQNASASDGHDRDAMHE